MSRENLVLENIASRQQLTALKQDRPRPPLDDFGRGFWVALRASWSGWVSLVLIVKPETVMRWQRTRIAIIPSPFIMPLTSVGDS